MATFLPDKLNMLEYKPSMVGIPTQSVARLYDRLDKQAYAADAQSTKIKTALAAQIAEASPNDAPYLQNMYNNVEGLIDQAKEEKNLPGYATQIRNMVGDMVSDQQFVNIQSNNVLTKKYNEDKNKMIMNFGAENVVDSGDNPATFSSMNPETGEPQRFMGQVTKRPDYTAAMMKLFKTKTDPLRNKKELEEFIYSLGESEDGSEAYPALQAYRDTPEGRIHMNDLSNEMFDTPYIRLAPEQAMQVEDSLNQKLENAGLLQMNSRITAGGVGAQSFSKDGIYKDEFNQVVTTSGVLGNTLTDGGDGEDQTIQLFNDGTEKSVMDQTLMTIVSQKGYHNIIDYDGEGQEIQQEDGPIDPNRIKSAQLTSALSPAGNAIIALTMNSQSKVDGGNDRDAAPSGVAYIEMMPEDMAQIQDNSLGLINQVFVNTPSPQTRKAFFPLMSSIAYPQVGAFLMDKTSEKVDLPNAREGGLTIKREGDYFVPYDDQGNQILSSGGARWRFESPGEVRTYVGRTVLQNNYGL
tara:strand:+ start:10371 stop:11936 length:1566 start_codon:yes stop_codon:yes gene_type:complete